MRPSRTSFCLFGAALLAALLTAAPSASAQDREDRALSEMSLGTGVFVGRPEFDPAVGPVDDLVTAVSQLYRMTWSFRDHWSVQAGFGWGFGGEGSGGRAYAGNPSLAFQYADSAGPVLWSVYASTYYPAARYDETRAQNLLIASLAQDISIGTFANNISYTTGGASAAIELGPSTAFVVAGATGMAWTRKEDRPRALEYLAGGLSQGLGERARLTALLHVIWLQDAGWFETAELGVGVPVNAFTPSLKLSMNLRDPLGFAFTEGGFYGVHFVIAYRPRDLDNSSEDRSGGGGLHSPLNEI